MSRNRACWPPRSRKKMPKEHKTGSPHLDAQQAGDRQPDAGRQRLAQPVYVVPAGKAVRAVFDVAGLAGGRRRTHARQLCERVLHRRAPASAASLPGGRGRRTTTRAARAARAADGPAAPRQSRVAPPGSPHRGRARRRSVRPRPSAESGGARSRWHPAAPRTARAAARDSAGTSPRDPAETARGVALEPALKRDRL